MKKYKRKPIVVESLELKQETTLGEVSSFLGYNPYWDGYAFHIPTSQGEMKACIGDFIIKGVQGEFYPCKGYIFRETYEEITDAS